MEDYTPTPEPGRILLIIQNLVGILYGAIFFGGILMPVGHQMFLQPRDFRSMELAEMSFMVCMMATVGMTYMDRFTRSIRDTRAVELWTMVALGVAPFSGFAYIVLGRYLRIWSATLISWPNFLIYAFGFYLPFIFLIAWVTYWHRQDEF